MTGAFARSPHHNRRLINFNVMVYIMYETYFHPVTMLILAEQELFRGSVNG
jgi:hypothetical protein